MNLAFKNKKLRKSIFLNTTCLVICIWFCFWIQESPFNYLDWNLLNHYHQYVVKTGKGPQTAGFPQIKYVFITDNTYQYTQTNHLDRNFLARLNDTLSELGTEAIAYDIIFPRPTNLNDDTAFAQSIERHGAVYMPIGISLSTEPKSFEWQETFAHEHFKTHALKKPFQEGPSQPLYGNWALMQEYLFTQAAANTGHISAYADKDGVFRHMPLVIKVDDTFFPALPLSMFLDHYDIPFEKIRIVWGQHIRIPAKEGRFLDKDVIIPIDKKGLALIPYHQTWSSELEKIGAHVLVEKMKIPTLQGNLADMFEGNFVFIGDISVGSSDLGDTPLEQNVPLIITQAAMLNGFLTQTFYSKWSVSSCLILIAVIGSILALCAILKPAWPLYAASMVIILGILLFSGLMFASFSIIPVTSLALVTVFITAGQIITIQIITQNDRAYIKGIFSTYVPDKIVDHILVNPQLLNLGGENRVLTLMMTDIRGYTAISSNLEPHEVITMLNRYFEKMFNIIIAHDGIVNEIIGDGILAFFGAPEYFEDHAAKAVSCAISMQNAMDNVNAENKKDGLPALEMGIGINTGEVIVGNIGSAKRAQYGVTGSEVNLTARTEASTVGGQILITDSVFCHLKSLLIIKQKISVGMKGIAVPVTLYDIAGIKAPYDLKLKEKSSIMKTLEPALDADIFNIDSKSVSPDFISAKITALSKNKAMLKTQQPLPELQNIRIHILTGNQTEKAKQIYAKTQSIESESQTNKNSCFMVCVDFTLVTPEAKTLIDSHN